MPPPGPSTPGPKTPKRGGAPFTPPSKQKLDKIVRLSGFKFERKHLFIVYNRETIYRILGALTANGREGKQNTVLRRVTVIYRNAIHTTRLFPTYDIESVGFWASVLSDVRKEGPHIFEDLSVPILLDIVSTYTQAYVDARDEQGDGVASGEETELDVTKPFKSSSDPRKILLPLVREWARIFRKHQAKKPQKSPTPDQDDPVTTYPTKLPEETDAEYITRLQNTVETMAKANAKEIASLKLEQAWSDEHNQDRYDRLYATLDRTEAKLREAESENRLAKLGVGGGEDDPWVPWREYELHLGIAEGVRKEGEDDHVDETGEGDLQL